MTLYQLNLLEIQHISDIYVSLTSNMVSLPQKYTIHCLFTHLGSEELTFGVDYFLEGKILPNSIQNDTCSIWPGLSCVYLYNMTSLSRSEIDSQLHVTWNASTVMAPTSVTSTQYSAVVNGDHHFSCSTVNVHRNSLNITVRGIYMINYLMCRHAHMQLYMHIPYMSLFCIWIATLSCDPYLML